MNWILTIYVCSIITGQCFTPTPEVFDYKKDYGTHYGCVRAGLGDSFEFLFSGDTFSANVIEKYEIYPQFKCEKNKIEQKDT